MKKSPNKLKAYSLLAASFLFPIVKSNGQVIYTDIEPDFILNNDNDFLNIDMDHNGIIDFAFNMSRSTNYESWTDFIEDYKKFAVGSIGGNINSVAASYRTIGWAMYSSYQVELPYALNEGYPINVLLSFQNGRSQTMVRKEILDPDGGTYRGNWIEDLDNYYLGVRFTDAFENQHYGWIRCSIKNDGGALIIKDFAYEIEPNGYIYAGDTLQYTSILNQSIGDTINIIFSNKNIYVSNNTQIGNTTLYIFNMQGSQVEKVIIDCVNQSISVNHLSNGNYLLQIISENQNIEKIISIY